MDGVKLPPPEMRQVFGTHLQYVEYIIYAALRRVGGVGMTTRELTHELLLRQGALTGSLRDNWRAATRGPANQEVRAALAVMLLDGKVQHRGPLGTLTFGY